MNKPTSKTGHDRLAALTCVSPAMLAEIFGVGDKPGIAELDEQALTLKGRQDLFFRLLIVRMVQLGVVGDPLNRASRFIAEVVIKEAGDGGDAWLVLSSNSQELKRNRAYLVDALGRAADRALLILDVAAAWRLTE